MNKPLLSILIPTYNRSDSLNKIIDKISKSFFIEYNNIVEFIISDNSDLIIREKNKKKIELVNKYLYRSSCRRVISYIENYENIGYGKNLIKLFNESTARYFWYISDGDEINESALFIIINCLKKSGNKMC